MKFLGETYAPIILPMASPSFHIMRRVYAVAWVMPMLVVCVLAMVDFDKLLRNASKPFYCLTKTI
jgi:hypothetical protein